MFQNGQFVDRAVGEMIRIIDTWNQEIKYIKSIFKEKTGLINAKARAVFGMGSTTGMIKYMGGYNYYSTRNRIINSNSIMNQCSRCINIENWKHVILCIVNEERNTDFIFQLKEKMLLIEGMEEITYKAMQFIENMRNYLLRQSYFIII